MQATLPAKRQVDIVSPRFSISRDMVAIIAVMQFPPGIRNSSKLECFAEDYSQSIAECDIILHKIQGHITGMR